MALCRLHFVALAATYAFPGVLAFLYLCYFTNLHGGITWKLLASLVAALLAFVLFKRGVGWPLLISYIAALLVGVILQRQLNPRYPRQRIFQ